MRKLVNSAFFRGVGSIMDLGGVGNPYIEYIPPISFKNKRRKRMVSVAADTTVRSSSSQARIVVSPSHRAETSNDLALSKR